MGRNKRIHRAWCWTKSGARPKGRRATLGRGTTWSIRKRSIHKLAIAESGFPRDPLWTYPMELGIPPLRIQTLLESNPPKFQTPGL